jgi:hypothetical protein
MENDVGRLLTNRMSFAASLFVRVLYSARGDTKKMFAHLQETSSLKCPEIWVVKDCVFLHGSSPALGSLLAQHHFTKHVMGLEVVPKVLQEKKGFK